MKFTIHMESHSAHKGEYYISCGGIYLTKYGTIEPITLDNTNDFYCPTKADALKAIRLFELREHLTQLSK